MEEKFQSPLENIDAVMEGLPEDKRASIQAMMASLQFEVSQSMNPDLTLMQKVTSEHVTQIIEQENRAMENHYKDKKEGRKYIIILIIIAAFIVFGLIFLLKDNENLLEKIVSTLIGLITGAIGGFGVGKAKSGQNSE